MGEARLYFIFIPLPERADHNKAEAGRVPETGAQLDGGAGLQGHRARV